MPEVRRRGDRQHAADRLDPVGVAMVVDERDHHFASAVELRLGEKRRRLPQNLVRALQLDDSRAPALSARARSSVVRPARWPASRSAWRTQRRSVSVVQPSFRRDRRNRRPLRAVLGACAPAPSGRRAHAPPGNTCSVVPWAPSSHRMGPPTNPVRFTPPLHATGFVATNSFVTLSYALEGAWSQAPGHTARSRFRYRRHAVPSIANEG